MAAKRRIYYQEFRRALDTEPLKPVYLFSGAENFLKEEGLQALLEKALPPADRNLNFESLYAGPEISGEEVRDRALTLPFFMSCRVIIVRQVEKWRAGDLAAISDYLNQPSPSTVLLLSSQEEKLKTAAWTQLAAKAYHVECYPLFDNQVPDWIEHRSRDHGKRIEREATQLLIERVGQTLTDLDNELGKLASYVGVRDKITEADVQEAAGHTRQNSILEFSAAFARRDSEEAVSLIEKLIAEGGNAPQILGALGWHLRTLYGERSRLDAGENLEQILVYLRNPQAKRERTAQIRAFTREEYPAILKELLKLDEHVKSGKPHWELSLVGLILKFCGTKAGVQAGRR